MDMDQDTQNPMGKNMVKAIYVKNKGINWTLGSIKGHLTSIEGSLTIMKGTMTSIEKSLNSIEKIHNAQTHNRKLMILRGDGDQGRRDFGIMREFHDVKKKEDMEKRERELSLKQGKNDKDQSKDELTKIYEPSGFLKGMDKGNLLVGPVNTNPLLPTNRDTSIYLVLTFLLCRFKNIYFQWRI